MKVQSWHLGVVIYNQIVTWTLGQHSQFLRCFILWRGGSVSHCNLLTCFSLVKITLYSRKGKLTSKVIIRIWFLQLPISGNWITMWHLHSMMGGFVSMNFQISHDHNPSYSISRWVQSETYYTLSLCLCLTLVCVCLCVCCCVCLCVCLWLCLWAEQWRCWWRPSSGGTLTSGTSSTLGSSLLVSMFGIGDSVKPWSWWSLCLIAFWFMCQAVALKWLELEDIWKYWLLK